MYQKQLDQVLEGAHLQPADFLVKRCVIAALRELAEGPHQSRVGAVADQHAGDELLGKHGQRNLARNGRREHHAQPLVLTLQNADDHRFEQCVLVRKTTIDSPRRQSSVLGDPGNGGPLDSVLSQHFRRCLQ